MIFLFIFQTHIFMEKQPIIIEFDAIEYVIDNYEYVYTNTIPRQLSIEMDIEFPKEESPLSIMIAFGIDHIIESTGRDNQGLEKYINKVIEGFEGQKDHELLAFQSLEADGFDMQPLLRYSLKGVKMTINESE